MNRSSDPWEATKRQYGFDGWPVVDNNWARFVPQLDELTNVTLDHRSVIPNAGNAFIDHYRDNADQDVWIAVSIQEHASSRDAQEGLIDILAHSMATQLPRCADRGMDIGDVCFCGFDELVDGLFFVRQNVLVRVESVGPKRAAVVDLARIIDAQIARRQ